MVVIVRLFVHVAVEVALRFLALGTCALVYDDSGVRCPTRFLMRLALFLTVR